MPTATEAPKIVQSTVRLPEPLYQQVKELLDKGHLDAGSFNEVMVSALRELVRVTQEKLLDAQFAGMATDEKYAEQCRVLAGEFARADWEALPGVSDRATR